MIIPTVGRKVWYRPTEADKKGISAMAVAVADDQPLDATVIAATTEKNGLAVVVVRFGSPARTAKNSRFPLKEFKIRDSHLNCSTLMALHR